MTAGLASVSSRPIDTPLQLAYGRIEYYLAIRALATSIKLDDDLNNRVRRLAEQRQRSPHWIMREAIREYVSREEARESFRQEAMASWLAYRETGRHLTGDEARAWLDGWGAEVEDEPPACHE